MTRHPEKRIETDFTEQDVEITRAFGESFRIYIDGWKALYPLSQSMLMHTSPFDECAIIRNFGIGQHVARVEFKSPSGQVYSHTWVFEVKSDGIVPE